MLVDDQIGLNGRRRVHHVDGGGQGIGANRGSVEGRHPDFDAVGTGVVWGKIAGKSEGIGRKRRYRTRIGLAGGWASIHPVIQVSGRHCIETQVTEATADGHRTVGESQSRHVVLNHGNGIEGRDRDTDIVHQHGHHVVGNIPKRKANGLTSVGAQ